MHKQIKYYNANFHSDGLLDNDVREVPLFLKKEKNIWKGHFYQPHRSNWIHVLWKYFPNHVFTKDMNKNLK